MVNYVQNPLNPRKLFLPNSWTFCVLHWNNLTLWAPILSLMHLSPKWANIGMNYKARYALAVCRSIALGETLESCETLNLVFCCYSYIDLLCEKIFQVWFTCFPSYCSCYILKGSLNFLHTFSMALYHKLCVKTGSLYTPNVHVVGIGCASLEPNA